jgi:hypothetical protein
MADFTETASVIAESLGVFSTTHEFSINKSITYNSGKCIKFYWQVEGLANPDEGTVVCEDGTGSDITPNSDFMVVILACNLEEVCAQLVERRLQFQLTRIVKFTQPAFTEDQEFCDDVGKHVQVYPGEELPADCLQFLNGNGGGTSLWRGAQMVKASDVEIQPTEDESTTMDASEDRIVSGCECSPIPLVLYLGHNLQTTGKLEGFLFRNRLTMPSSLKMVYNQLNQSWQENLHYDGLAEDGVATETWKILFEWACTDHVAALESGDLNWKLSIYAKRRNLSTGEDFDTRVLIVFIPNRVCDGEVNLNFEFTLNTETEAIVDASTVSDLTPSLNLLFDNIGMFKSTTWLENPLLEISVRQTPIEGGFTPFDISSIFPGESVTLV